ncbi:MAG: OB-fold nucleic acid binding domain-containing protein, partial [Bdellovibrionia bacterium]
MTTHENPLRAEKRRKLKNLRDAGVNPFPYEFQRTHTLGQLREKFGHLKAGDKLEDQRAQVAGRMLTRRDMGKAAFFNLRDQSGDLQIYLKSEELTPEEQTIYDNLDIGDFVGVDGFVFCTKKGELSVHVKKLSILAKTLEPLPEKFHGLADTELKYRYRHLDLIMDPESRKVFETRSKIIREIRQFLDGRGFLEVE